MLDLFSPVTAGWLLVAFFFLHWFASAFSQTFFLHRYSSHNMFTMSTFWEKFFYLGTFLTQGSSFLVPRAYAVMHRAHHAHSDTEKDPHSPHFFQDVFGLMWHTKNVYEDIRKRRGKYYEARFEKNFPQWNALDTFGNSWLTRLAWCAVYTGIYVAIAPSPWFFLLLPVHFLMGPVHGAAVNWCGHKYGYQNYANGDHSRNTTPFDLFLMGELFQNNHHKYPGRAKFATRWWEFDVTYPTIKLLHHLRIIRLKPKAHEGKIAA